jgi:hypothetical protein
MKLKAEIVPYSSIVGGGLMLTTEDGASAFILNFIGTTKGITKDQTEAISKKIAGWINENGLEVPAHD